MKRFLSFKSQRGTALLSALLITALAASLVAQVASQQSLLITQSNWSRGSARAGLAMQYGKHLAMEQIYNQLEKNKDHKLHMVPVKIFDLGKRYGVDLTMTLVDAQSKWNINALSGGMSGAPINHNSGQDLVALLKEATSGEHATGNTGMLPISPLGDNKAQILANEMQNFIGPYSKDSADAYYMKHQPPFYPGHQMMMQITQLRGVKGVSRALYQHLSQVMTALPTNQNMLNINDLPTNDSAIASALGISESQIPAWKSCRQSLMLPIINNKSLTTQLGNCSNMRNIREPGGTSQNNTGSIADRVATGEGTNEPTTLTTNTNYIFVNIQAKIGIQKLGLHALLHVSYNYGRIVIAELWQDNNLSDGI